MGTINFVEGFTVQMVVFSLLHFNELGIVNDELGITNYELGITN